MSILRHFINEIDYEKLIKIQANMPVQTGRAVNFTKDPKNIKVSSQPKVKKLGKRK